MRISHFFIERPIFAAVLSVLLTLAGAIAQGALPVSEYPEIAPPTVNISATYPGASADVIAETVASPIEQEVNGVDDMLYITSQSTGDGRVSIDVVFKPGVNIDLAQVLVQNRVAIANPRLPEEVTRFGVVVKKASPDLMMVVHLLSPDGSRDQQYISNYATLYVKDAIARIDGRRRRAPLWRERLFDARLARSGESRGARSDGGRRHRRAARRQSASRRGRGQSAASGLGGRLPAFGADSGTAQHAGAIRRHRHPRRRRRPDLPARHRAHRIRRAGLYAQRLSQPRRCDGARHLSASRLERLADRRSRQAGDGAAQEEFPRRRRLHGRLQSHRIHPAVGGRGRPYAARGDRPRRSRRHPVPADVAGGDHSRGGDPGVADRQLRRDEGRRPQLQHALALRPGARHRHRRRRRDRRRGECRALSRARALAQGSRAQDDG